MREIFITSSGDREAKEGVKVIKTHDIIYIDIADELKKILLIDNLGLVFTSKNALISLEKSMRKVDSNKELLSAPTFIYGAKVCKLARNMGMNIAYCGEQSSGDEFFKALKCKAHKELKLIFLCAKKIASNPPPEIIKLICYEAKALADLSIRSSLSREGVLDVSPTLPKDSIIIFCSSSQVDAMEKMLEKDMTAIALGNQTFKKLSALSKKKGFEALLSPKQDLACCMEQARKLQN